MPVKGDHGLTLQTHEELSRRLLLARAHLAQVSSTVLADGSWRLARPIAHTLEAALRELDRARDRLAAALAAEHAVVHPALAKRIYYPLVDGPQEGV
jgi:hypothetical protein